MDDEFLIEPEPRLPKAPKRVPPRTAHALQVYDRLMARRTVPLPDARSIVLQRRLSAAVQALNPRELASYYAGLVERRQRAG